MSRVEHLINRIYKAVFKKVFGKSKLKSVVSKKSTPEITLAQLETSKQYDEFAKKFSKELSKAGMYKKKGIWRKYYSAAREKHLVGLPSTYTDFELLQLQKAMEHNFKLIKSIPSYVLSVYQQKDIQIALEQVANGSIGRKSFENQLKSHGAKNAKLIARTETAKLQTAIDRNSAKDLGSVCYMWLSVKDRRTRKSHQDMNNVIVFWRSEGQKPRLDGMEGDAGEFPNCRCTPLALFDETDLTKSTYKVYNYLTHKIETTTKNNLITLLKKGGF